MKVAVYTIALNEEHFVQRWYESAKDADYLLIADTGSTDNTVATANELGINTATIMVKPWRFDNARNAALALLPADIDYCIALDMDEVLIPGWRQSLEKAFQMGVTRPRYQYTWSWKDKEETIPGLQYGGDKIHSRFGYRWKHPVHEVIVNDRIEEIQAWCDLQIHHHPDHSKSRGQYMPLLKLAVEEDPQDDRNSHYYARELFFHYQFDEAKQEFLRHLSLPRAAWKPERAASMRYIAKCSDGKEREEWFIKAVKETPDRREPLVDLANHYYQNQEWEKCLKYAKQALAITDKPLEYLCEEEAWGSLPYDLASISSWNLNRVKDAIKYGIDAISFTPNDERLKNNLSFYLRYQYVNEKSTVVIPSKSNIDGLSSLVNSLKNDIQIHSIIIVSDGEDAYNEHKKLFDNNQRVIVEKVELSSGIHKMWNIGIKHARKNKTALALLNDDITISSDAVGSMTSLLSYDRKIGLACPDYDNRSFQSPFVETNQTCRGRYDGTGGLAGFFMILAKDLVKDWTFDENMKWWYGDDDILYWTLSKDRKVVIASIAKCNGNQSFTTHNNPPENFNEIIDLDRQIFESKWLNNNML